MTFLMLIVLSISIAITAMKFGAAALQDNFVAEISTNYENSIEFVAFYGLLNFYMYTMAFVYSPSKNAQYETNFKDNPALSMLNDSDEEVHYGSDAEEISLTTRRGNRYQDEEETFQWGHWGHSYPVWKIPQSNKNHYDQNRVVRCDQNEIQTT